MLLDGDVHVFGAGSHFTIPAGAVHGVWNGGAVEARAVWRTLPALRTLELFEDIDGLYRAGVVAPTEMPSLTMWATLLTEYRDILRLAAKPAGRGPRRVRAAGDVGRRRGYLPRRELRAEAETRHGLASGVGDGCSSPPSSLRSTRRPAARAA